MSSPKISVSSNRCVSHKITCRMNDTFVSCMKNFEALLPYFERERTDDYGICRKLLQVDEMLTKLNKELLTLKTEYTTFHNKHELTKQSLHRDEVKTNVKKDHQSEQTKIVKANESNFQFICDKCNSSVTLYNYDYELSVALHNQGECHTQGLSKPTVTHIVGEKKMEKKVFAQEPMKNASLQNSKCQKGTGKSELDKTLSDRVCQAEGGKFNNIQCTETGFKCNLCKKILSGSKVILEHVKGHDHQDLLKKLLEKITSQNDVTNTKSHIDLPVILRKIPKSLYINGHCLSQEKCEIKCSLCQCNIPATVQNVQDHLTGNRHSKNQLIQECGKVLKEF